MKPFSFTLAPVRRTLWAMALAVPAIGILCTPCFLQADTPAPAAPAGQAATGVQLPAKDKFHLFLLAGQSNMAGRGNVDAGQKPDPRIFALNKQLEWQLAKDPLHWDKGAAGAGLGIPFAREVIAKTPEISVGLIPAACGGSSLAVWKPGAFFTQTNSHPWDDAIARTRLAQRHGTLRGILWHQGESDANPRSAPLHEKQLTDLIARFRAEFQDDNLPFVIGQLGQFPGREWTPSHQTLFEAQKAVAAKVPGVYFVGSDGLLSRGDNLHFNTEALQVLGLGYAKAYLGHVAAKK